MDASKEQLVARVAELEAEVKRLRSLVAEKHATRRRTEWLATLKKASALASKRQLETGDWKAHEVPQVTRAGWLSKRKCRPSSQLMQYKRWFLLIGNELFYFKEKEDAVPRGSILLVGCSLSIVSPVERCMELVAPASDKAYLLFAETETELDEWAAAIAEASIMSLRVDLPGAHVGAEELPSEVDRPAATAPASVPSAPGSGETQPQDASAGAAVSATRAAPAATASEAGESGSSAADGYRMGDRRLSVEERMALARPFFEKLMDVLRSTDRPLSQERFSVARRVLGDVVGTRAFVEAVNSERSQAELALPANYHRMCDLVSTALQTAFETDDFRSARSLMNMANTYFTPSPKGRVYVMTKVKLHKIWTSMRSWEGIFYDAVLSEMRRHVIRVVAPTDGDSSSVTAASAEEELDPMEVENRIDHVPVEERQNVVFGQLLSFANEMVRFRLSYSSVSHFLMKTCIASQLSEDKRSVLFEHLNGIFAAEYGDRKK